MKIVQEERVFEYLFFFSVIKYMATARASMAPDCGASVEYEYPDFVPRSTAHGAGDCFYHFNVPVCDVRFVHAVSHVLAKKDITLFWTNRLKYCRIRYCLKIKKPRKAAVACRALLSRECCERRYFAIMHVLRVYTVVRRK